MQEQRDIVKRVEEMLHRQPAGARALDDWDSFAARLSAARQRRAVRKARLVGVVCGILSATAAGAGVQGVRVYILRVNDNGKAVDLALPVDGSDAPQIEFQGDGSDGHRMTITPDMVGPDGVIKGVEWNVTPVEAASEEKPPQ